MKKVALFFAVSMITSLSAFADGSGGTGCFLTLQANPCGSGIARTMCCYNSEGELYCPETTCASVVSSDGKASTQAVQIEAAVNAALSN